MSRTPMVRGGQVISDFRTAPPLPQNGVPAVRPAVAPARPAMPTVAASAPMTPPPGAAAALNGDVSTPTAATPPVATEDPGPAAPNHISFAKPAVPDVEPKEKAAPKSGLRDALSIVGVLVSALILAFGLITFVFQSYQVDGPSMQTTLENSDHLIVWKVPKSFAKLTGRHYIPNRGDVIVFNEKGINGSAQSKQLIKRVIALPGERVTVKDGIVTVYNEENPEGFQPDKTLPYGSVITTTPGNRDDTLGEGQIFVCGDNRTNSADSRMFGPIESDQIVGKLVIRVLPLNSVKAF